MSDAPESTHELEMGSTRHAEHLGRDPEAGVAQLPEQPPAGEELRLIQCKLCGQEMREITTTHLKAAHGWKEGSLVERYKRLFNVESVRSPLSLATRGETGWTRERLKREIQRIRRVGCALDSKTILKSHESIYRAACALEGSWEKALARVGVDYDAVRLRQKWTRGKILGWICESRALDLDLRAGVVKEERGGVFNAACRLFGGWKGALLEADRLDGEEDGSWTPFVPDDEP